MKQTDISNCRQIIHCISNRMRGCETSHTGMQLYTGLIDWLPDSPTIRCNGQTAVCTNADIAGQSYCRTAAQFDRQPSG
ncbi:MAG: hypothetical protein LBH32_08515 [Dysgonamonadaceae bacterium]|jgi:hypothetical protein|nr:hypothetical protein [Dysgonamonadaceae bacterium]